MVCCVCECSIGYVSNFGCHPGGFSSWVFSWNQQLSAALLCQCVIRPVSIDQLLNLAEPLDAVLYCTRLAQDSLIASASGRTEAHSSGFY